MRSVNSKTPLRFHWASFPSPHVFVIKSKAAELWQPEIVLSKGSSLIVPQMWLLNVCMRETCPLFPFIVLVEFYHCLEMLSITSFSLLFFLSLPYSRQLKNGLRDNLCLDQGPDTDNIPIMYLCHGMTPQVSGLSFYSIMFCFFYSIPPLQTHEKKQKSTDHTDRSSERLSAVDN